MRILRFHGFFQICSQFAGIQFFLQGAIIFQFPFDVVYKRRKIKYLIVAILDSALVLSCAIFTKFLLTYNQKTEMWNFPIDFHNHHSENKFVIFQVFIRKHFLKVRHGQFVISLSTFDRNCAKWIRPK